MKVTVFNGSPKGRRSNTSIIVENFLQGAQDAGAKTEQVFLSTKKITPCTSCKNCWQKTPGICAQDDDMAELIEKIKSSEVIGYATPLFIDNVSGLMKNFMDRMIVLGDPHWVKDENGECRHVMRYPNPKKMIAISNCGYPEQSHFAVLRVLFRRMARNTGMTLDGEIYRGGGALLRSTDASIKPFIEQYKQLVQKAGAELVNEQKISKETTTLLENPLLPTENFVDMYFEKANEISDKFAQTKK
jgi:multimeric flavodoxin WrbA